MIPSKRHNDWALSWGSGKDPTVSALTASLNRTSGRHSCEGVRRLQSRQDPRLLASPPFRVAAHVYLDLNLACCRTSVICLWGGKSGCFSMTAADTLMHICWSHGKLHDSDSSLFQKSPKEAFWKWKQLSSKKSQEKKKIEHVSIDMPWEPLHIHHFWGLLSLLFANSNQLCLLLQGLDKDQEQIMFSEVYNSVLQFMKSSLSTYTSSCQDTSISAFPQTDCLDTEPTRPGSLLFPVLLLTLSSPVYAHIYTTTTYILKWSSSHNN